MGWGFIIIAGLFTAGAFADLLVGSEEGASLFDELAGYAETALGGLEKFWKSTMGEVHSTLFNLFVDTMKGSKALSKLVAATATAGLSLALLDWFSGVLQKANGTCVSGIFNFINTPVVLLKATIYNWNEVLGYLSDVFLIPVELVVAFVALALLAIWDVIKFMGPAAGLAGYICQIFQISGPCCSNV